MLETAKNISVPLLPSVQEASQANSPSISKIAAFVMEGAEIDADQVEPNLAEFQEHAENTEQGFSTILTAAVDDSVKVDSQPMIAEKSSQLELAPKDNIGYLTQESGKNMPNPVMLSALNPAPQLNELEILTEETVNDSEQLSSVKALSKEQQKSAQVTIKPAMPDAKQLLNVSHNISTNNTSLKGQSHQESEITQSITDKEGRKLGQYLFNDDKLPIESIGDTASLNNVVSSLFEKGAAINNPINSQAIMPTSSGFNINEGQAFAGTDIKTTQLSVPLNLGNSDSEAQWTKNFNEQVVLLSNQQTKVATLKLRPAELGPVEVHIHMNKDAANIQFNSHHSQVRELIEQALPRLREMMTEQGIQLADVDIQSGSQQNFKKEFNSGSGDSHEQNQQTNSISTAHDSDQPAGTEEQKIVSQLKQGLVDYFV